MFKVNINQDAKLPITCPHCGKQSEELVSRLRTNPQITCEGCGGAIAVKGEQLDAFVKTLESFGRK